MLQYSKKREVNHLKGGYLLEAMCNTSQKDCTVKIKNCRINETDCTVLNHIKLVIIKNLSLNHLSLNTCFINQITDHVSRCRSHDRHTLLV